MSIGHVVATDSGFIASNRVLGDGVNDFLAVAVLVQVFKGPCPAVSSGDNLGIDFLAVSQQMNRNAVGTDAVLVVSVIPGLGTGNRHLLRNVGVGHVGAVHSGSIAGNRLLRDSILDLYTLVSVLVRSELPCPVITGNRLGINLLSISQQVDGDALRTLAILVIVVIPSLGTGDGDLRRVMGVGHSVAVNGLGVTRRNIYLVNRINHQSLTGGVLRQILKRSRPIIFCADSHGSAVRHAVGIQLQLHTVRTDTIPVVIIGPALGHSDINGKEFRQVSSLDVDIVATVCRALLNQRLQCRFAAIGFCDGQVDRRAITGRT